MSNFSLEKPRNEQYVATILSGTDSADIERVLINEILQTKISGLAESRAKELYLTLDQILEQDGAEDALREDTQDLSNDDKVLYAKFLTIKNSCRSAAMVIATRNATSQDNKYDVDHMIGEMKDNNVAPKELATILGTITQWKTGTPHPTQHLSEEGQHLFRDMLAANSLPAEERFSALQTAITGMFDADITRKKRMTVREETDSDRKQAQLHREGQRQTYFDLQAALDKHYGDDAPDLLSDNIHMTLPYHTWNGAGDADGKPNADKKALFEGMVGYSLDAVFEHLNDINQAIELDSSLASKLDGSQASLQIVHDRLSAIEKKLRDENDTASFEDLKNDLKNAYKGLNIDETPVDSEKKLYNKLTNNIAHAINEANSEAQLVLKGGLFVMHQYKDTLTTAKVEKRAPGPVDVEIINTLFGDEKFQKEFLNGPMKRALANKVFSTLSPDEQRGMMGHVASQIKKDKQPITDHYKRIFPEGLDDKNFPNQLRERGERFELQSMFPNKFGMSIVAEASRMSPEYAFFLGEQVFGVKPMMHTMLNEDMQTLEESPDYLIDFTKHGGMQSVFEAAANDPKLKNYLEKHGAMLPCSDSTKQLGPGALFMQAQAINLMMEHAVENGKTICIKWGNGMTLTRGGGNAHVPGRLKAQAVQWHLNGRALDLNDQKDVQILANVMFSSNTEQGRAADFMSPNASRISRNHLNMIGEMLGRALELTGKVEQGTYIPQVAKFSKGTRHIFSQIAKDTMMRGYENLRDAVDADSNRMSDAIAEQTSNMKVAADANQAARPASKAVEVTDGEGGQTAKASNKALYDLRAIGTTVAISHMQTYHDGWFTLGSALQEIHNAYLDHEIGNGDMEAFMDDPLWTSMIKNGLRTASMSDLIAPMAKVGAGDWSHTKAMKIGKSVRIIPSENPEEKPPLFTFDGAEDGVTAEQAYLAKLYYDQALFITYTDVMAGFKLKKNALPKTLEDVEQLAMLHLDNEENQIGRFQIGQNTDELFPRVNQDNNNNRLNALPAQILADTVEPIHSEFSQEELYAITAAQRATQVWNNNDLYMDQDAYGSKPAQRAENTPEVKQYLDADLEM